MSKPIHHFYKDYKITIIQIRSDFKIEIRNQKDITVLTKYPKALKSSEEALNLAKTEVDQLPSQVLSKIKFNVLRKIELPEKNKPGKK